MPLAGTVPAWFHGVYGTPYRNSPPFRAAFRRRSSGVPALPERFRRSLLERRRNAGLFQRAFRLRSGPVPDILWTSQIAMDEMSLRYSHQGPSSAALVSALTRLVADHALPSRSQPQDDLVTTVMSRPPW